MTARVTISLPDDLLAQLDMIASCESLTRSDVVREAASQYLAVRATDTEAAQRLQSVEEGIAWLRLVAEKPSADATPSLEILHAVRGEASGEREVGAGDRCGGEE